MKRLLLLAVICSLFSFSCNLDFSNTTDDEWVVFNNTKNYNSENPLKVLFNTEEKTITAKLTTIKAPEDAEITIAESYHVDFEKSYSYASSPAKRKLTITDQTKYIYTIINNSSNKIFIEYKEDVTELEASNNVTLTEYKAKPNYSIYYLNGTTKVYYSEYSEQLSGTCNYTITIN
ncbi:MAG: hypothetical protein J6S67_03225 [Methanobrevibacter sp.]|nr:hypothetical protein [Methanobrevibacter sp.]